ncbi:hypothetical protein NDU88_006448 [Pleurodeles waltl]|uniref:Cadherin domain-containing protein n=1 Tax=Pleurodeles waltl TaxID=8319 RepID=A0AAV7PIC4_PLEWA|nr:hypothetical protein NDU88_006448 [Pleurodeles waltl]
MQHINSHPCFTGLFLLCLFIVLSAAIGEIHYSIPEEIEKGSFVRNIAKDTGLKLAEMSERSVQIISRGKTQHFVFSLSNGYLSVREQIDRKHICPKTSLCLLIAELIAQNPLELYQFEVEITDINDNAPSFPKKEVVLEVSEISAPGTHLSFPKASDPDVVNNALKNYILSPSPYSRTEVTSESGDLIEPEFILENPLDREDMPMHNLILTDIDGGDPARTGSLQVKVVILDTNDNPPVFSQSVYNVSVREDVDEVPLGYSHSNRYR